ncbi:hypothetical protein ACWEQ4_01055 [Rhodococcus sp. NPDC003994]
MARLLGRSGTKSAALPGNRRCRCDDCYNAAQPSKRTQRRREKRALLTWWKDYR